MQPRYVRGAFSLGVAMKRKTIFAFFLPGRIRKATSTADRFYVVGYSYEPDGKNLPAENWKRVGTISKATADEYAALDRDGFLVTEIANLVVKPDASVRKVYVFQRTEEVNGKTLVWPGYTTDVLGKKLGADEWMMTGSFDVEDDTMLKPEVFYGLSSEGVFVGLEPLKPEWEEKWFMFYDPAQQKFYEGKSGPMEMWVLGVSLDPDGMNLPSGSWKLCGAFEVNSFLTGRHLNIQKIHGEISAKGFYTQWVEVEDKAGLGKLNPQPSKPAGRGILPNTPARASVQNPFAQEFADRIWERLKK